VAYHELSAYWGGKHGKNLTKCKVKMENLMWASILNIFGQVKVIFLDFAKAFNTVPPERLLHKANYYAFPES